MRPEATARSSTSVILVECFVPGIDVAGLEEIAKHGQNEANVEFVGAIAIPADETCLYLFTGQSAVAPSAVRRGDRTVEAILAGPWLPSRPGRKDRWHV
jgi:hypothetical protein